MVSTHVKKSLQIEIATKEIATKIKRQNQSRTCDVCN